MIPEVSDFIPGSLEDTDIHIEVVDGHLVTAVKQKQVRIKIYNNKGYAFIATSENVILATYLCDRLFSIITLVKITCRINMLPKLRFPS